MTTVQEARQEAARLYVQLFARYGKTHRCPTCLGSRRMQTLRRADPPTTWTKEPPAAPGIYNDVIEVTCPDCHGTGLDLRRIAQEDPNG